MSQLPWLLILSPLMYSLRIVDLKNHPNDFKLMKGGDRGSDMRNATNGHM